MRPATRYAAMAQALLADIRSGRYAVGADLPTEAVLQERFGVSRHTVRQALRELRELGVVSSQQGKGTRVRSAEQAPRFVHVSPSIDDLLGFAQATRMRVLSSSEVVCDAALAAQLGCTVGQAWRKLQVLRDAGPGTQAIGFIAVYLRPEYAAVVPRIQASAQPVFTLVEETYGVRLAEIRQRIDAVLMDEATRKRLKAGAQELSALQIVRSYVDDQARLVQVSVGVYPGSRFSLQNNIRVQRGAAGA